VNKFITNITAALKALFSGPARLTPKFAHSEKVLMTGHVSWRYLDAHGNPITNEQAATYGLPSASGEFKNLVVTTGKNLMASLWAGVGTAPTHIAMGSGATAEAVGQTTLVAETARVALDTRTSNLNVTTVIGTFPAGTGTGTVNEIGLFNAAAAGTMTQRALTGAITKPAGLGLQFTWTTTFN
jgi:hypothetical protein